MDSLNMKLNALYHFCNSHTRCIDCYLYKMNNGGFCFHPYDKNLIEKNWKYLKEYLTSESI